MCIMVSGGSRVDSLCSFETYVPARILTKVPWASLQSYHGLSQWQAKVHNRVSSSIQALTKRDSRFSLRL